MLSSSSTRSFGLGNIGASVIAAVLQKHEPWVPIIDREKAERLQSSGVASQPNTGPACRMGVDAEAIPSEYSRYRPCDRGPLDIHGASGLKIANYVQLCMHTCRAGCLKEEGRNPHSLSCGSASRTRVLRLLLKGGLNVHSARTRWVLFGFVEAQAKFWS